MCKHTDTLVVWIFLARSLSISLSRCLCPPLDNNAHMRVHLRLISVLVYMRTAHVYVIVMLCVSVLLFGLQMCAKRTWRSVTLSSYKCVHTLLVST